MPKSVFKKLLALVDGAFSHRTIFFRKKDLFHNFEKESTEKCQSKFGQSYHWICIINLIMILLCSVATWVSVSLLNKKILSFPGHTVFTNYVKYFGQFQTTCGKNDDV